MSASKEWQLARESAERYQRVLVPTILGPAAHELVDWAALQPGESVLDVGCGTGAAARRAAERVGPQGRIAAIDVNAGMIDVARAEAAAASAVIDWRVADAAALPFADDEFDAVVVAQTLQFIGDKAAALREMRRVCKPGGRIAVAVWADIEQNPYFEAVVQAVERHIAADAGDALRAACSLGSATEVHRLLDAAGFRDVDLRIAQLDLELPPLRGFVPEHVAATPMAAAFAAAPDGARNAVVDEVAARFAGSDAAAAVEVPFRTLLALAWK